jgi:muramoyltetrapeptide carboxypeptidase
MSRAVKAGALRVGDVVRVVAPASGFSKEKLEKGCAELERLGYKVQRDSHLLDCEGFFAGSAAARVEALTDAFSADDVKAVICARGGYGSNYLLEGLENNRKRLRGDKDGRPKLFIGFSDLTTLHIYFEQGFKWPTLYGPMVCAGFDNGPDKPGGYESKSFQNAVSVTSEGWSIDLQGETITRGDAEGVLAGGCMTLLEATLKTTWEAETRGTILVLEDRAMKPYQVDRVLTHLKMSGKLKRVKGLIFGDFPECEVKPGAPTVQDVIARVTGKLGIPVIWRAPIGHTERALLTIPFGVKARFDARGTGKLEILESVCEDG